MSLSKYGSTVETTNLARLARIILGPCTDVLRDVLKKNMNPSVLPCTVKTFINHLPKLKKSPFTTQQEKIIYTGIYSDFDITLLYILFRNICTFPPHSKQWGNVPIPRDRSVSANIERIRIIKNKYQSHHSRISISSYDFNQEWQDIFDIVKELELYLGTCTVYQEEVKNITQCCMDPEQETKHIEQLLDLNKKLDDISVQFENSCVCKKRKELFDREVSRWKEDDKVYLETHNFPAMFNKVVNLSYMTFVGVPGSGKSVTARHIALKLQEEGYDILPIKDISDIENHCNPEIPQVFVIDDVVGVFGLDMSEFNKLCKYESSIKKPEMKETKVLMTCREVVYRNEYITNTFLSENENVVYLHSDENSLTDQDKYNLLAKYNLDEQFLSSVDLSSTSKMFPFLCKLYSSTHEFENYGPSFFISPYPFILEEMDKLKIRNKIQYASLVLLMLNDRKLSETILDDDFSSNRNSSFQEKKISVLKRCKVDRETNSFRFINALSEMDGTYTKKCESEFTFVHDSMFEIVACHFGRQFPEVMIQYMSSDYITRYIKVDKYESEHRTSANEESSECKASSLCIILTESHHQMFAKRLFTDVENGEMLVFGNEALKHPSVLQAFIGVMVGKSYRELYSLFLSELKAENDDEYSFLLLMLKKMNYEDSMEWIRDQDQIFDLFLNWRNRSTSNRAICWVIFYGFHQILQYIIDQILTKNGNVNDLFLNSYNEDDTISDKATVVFDTADNVRGSVMTASDSDIEFDIETCCEKITVEQFCLLCLGCCSGDQTTVKILLKHIDIEKIINTITYSQIGNRKIAPLDIACKFGYCDIAKQLLQPGTINMFGNSLTPIEVACGNGHLSVVKELIKAGADINCRYGTKTPLTAACKKGHVTVVDELIKAGVDINLADKKQTPLMTAFDQGHSNIVELLVKAGSETIHIDGHETSLTIACFKGQLEEVEKRIQAGTDVNLRDGGLTPLVAACYMGHLSVVKGLIKIGADVNLLDGDKTPLTSACHGGHSNVVEELMNSGASVNLKDKKTTPIIVSCSSGNSKVTKVLIKAGANVNIEHEGKTPLTVACSGGYIDVVEELIKGGADVNLKSGNDTPLTIACRKEYLTLVQMIINAGADVNLEDGNCSLLSAARYGHLNVVQELIKAGADINFRCGTNTPLTAACKKGHVTVVDELIKAGADMNLADKKETPLMTAFDQGHSNIVELLVKAGSETIHKGGHETSLTIACFRGQLEEVEKRIQAGADVNLRDGGLTPLVAACYMGHLSVVKGLIKIGADVNLLNGDMTPLTAACLQGHSNVAEELINAGAYVNLKDKHSTPLVTACCSKHLNVAEYLIKAGANVNLEGGGKIPLTAACLQGDLQTVVFLVKVGVNINLQDTKRTPLSAACRKGHKHIAEILIKAGADVNIEDTDNTPLTAACKEDHLHLVKNLIEAGSDVNFQTSYETALVAACNEGHLSVVETLIKAGADVNLTGQNGQYTPLIAACEKNNLETVNVLIRDGADVNLIGKSGEYTPLIAACVVGHLDVVNVFINAGADVNLRSKDRDFTPLIAACMNNHVDLVNALIKTGADVNMTGKINTPLSAACQGGHLKVVDALLKCGADVNLAGETGEYTPLLAASQGGHLEVFDLLIEAGANLTLFG